MNDANISRSSKTDDRFWELPAATSGGQGLALLPWRAMPALPQPQPPQVDKRD